MAAACGPVVGGLLVSPVGCRSIFWVNVPIGAAVTSATRQFGSVLGVAVMGDLVTTGVSAGLARGQGRPAALAAATHGAWAVAVGCGLVIALTGYLTTTAPAHASAAAIAAAPGGPSPAAARR